MQETANKQKRITLKTLHEMLNGMSVELAEKVHLLFMGLLDRGCVVAFHCCMPVF